jgi:hypothetical protein
VADKDRHQAGSTSVSSGIHAVPVHSQSMWGRTVTTASAVFVDVVPSAFVTARVNRTSVPASVAGAVNSGRGTFRPAHGPAH